MTLKLLYGTLGWLLYLLAFPPVYLYAMLTHGRLPELRQRLGRYDDTIPAADHSPRVWLHAASVGEVKAAAVLIAALNAEQLPATFVVTTVTRSGNRLARRLLPDGTLVLYTPFDVAPVVHRAVAALRPNLYVGLETEIWPALLARLCAARTPCILANARMSERSWRRYRRIRPLIGSALAAFREITAITDEDAARFADLGVDRKRITVCGNIKYDAAVTDPEKMAALAKRLAIPAGAPVFVCGSTREGEEDLLVPCAQRLAAEIKGLIWILAPRHLERLPAVEALLRKNGIAFDRFSDLGGEPGRRAATVLVDTHGDLSDIYGLATYAFCGGSLMDKGGHNIIEPVLHGIPVLYGPHMTDFQEARQILESYGVGFTVANGEVLCERILAFYRQPAEYEEARRRAAAFANRNHGAVDRQKRVILQALAPAGQRKPPSHRGASNESTHRP